MNKCEVCAVEFESTTTRRTCSKECKNKLASLITIKQFSDPSAREVQRQKSLVQKTDLAYQQKFKQAIDQRTARWQEQGHPRIGMQQPESAKQRIGAANTGRFKGKTWDEIYGKEVADRRRLENSYAMSKHNEILLKDRRSGLEDRLLPFLPTYENNVQISYYNVDFIDRATNHIIEVYGDYWHCNPKIYADDFMHRHLKITAVERRKLDETRIAYLESMGYSVTVVWESDLKEFIGSL